MKPSPNTLRSRADDLIAPCFIGAGRFRCGRRDPASGLAQESASLRDLVARQRNGTRHPERCDAQHRRFRIASVSECLGQCVVCSGEGPLGGDGSLLELVEVQASDRLGVRWHQVRPIHRTCAGQKSLGAGGQFDEVTEASGCTRQVHAPGADTGCVQQASSNLGRDAVRALRRPNEVDRSQPESAQRHDAWCRVTVQCRPVR